MARAAIILGSNGASGVETSTANMDLMKAIAVKEGWSQAVSKSFEFYAIDDIEVSINHRSSFTLKAGDEIEESEDYINSFIIITDGAKYRYYAKF